MTNEELLAKIKAEIERRLDKHWEGLPNADAPEDDWTHNELCELGAYKELEHLETFLSTLELEKPMNQNEDFEKEIADYWTTMGWSKVMTLAKFKVIARYFYGLGLGVNDL